MSDHVNYKGIKGLCFFFEVTEEHNLGLMQHLVSMDSMQEYLGICAVEKWVALVCAIIYSWRGHVFWTHRKKDESASCQDEQPFFFFFDSNIYERRVSGLFNYLLSPLLHGVQNWLCT